MLSFAFMHPQAIRLLLDRAEYEGIVLPSVTQKTSSIVQVYTDAVGLSRRQTPVFIYPDLQTMSTIVRSGAFDVSIGKHILCSSISLLSQHGFEAIDASSSESLWRVRANLRGTLHKALAKDAGVSDSVIDQLMKVPELPEQQFSNPIVKVEDKPCIEFSELSALLGNSEQKRAILIALLRYVTWSFVAEQASKLGSTPREITAAAVTKLMTANNREFVAYARQEKLKIPAAVIARAKTMFTTSAPASMIAFAVRRLSANRPYSLALAESGCLSGNAALIEASQLKASDFPTPSSVSTAAPRVLSSHSSGFTTTVTAGVYSFTQLLHIIGERVDHAYDVVRRSQSPIVFNRNPMWQNNDNCWEIKSGADFIMMYNGLKYRFCTEDSIRPASENPVTADSPLVVIKPKRARQSAATSKKPKAVPAPVIPAKSRTSRNSSAAVAVPAPAPRARAKTQKLLADKSEPQVKTLTAAQARKLLPAASAEKVVRQRVVQKSDATKRQESTQVKPMKARRG